MTPTSEKFIQEQGKNFDRKEFDAEFNAFMETQFKKTMGALTLQVFERAEFNEVLRSRISGPRNVATS